MKLSPNVFRSGLLFCLSLALLVGVGSVVSGLRAAPRSRLKKAKLPSASKQLKAALKNLGKKKSYDVTLKVVGGVTNSPQHTVQRATVRATYDAHVYVNKLMHVPALRAYRTPKKGVYLESGIWKNMSGRSRATTMDRLFDFPTVALYKAYRHGSKAKWADSSPSGERLTSVSKDSRKKPTGHRGKTIVVDKSREDAADALIPRVVRVEIPPKEAINHFVTVESSGCFGGG